MRARCYWGYCFEALATENAERAYGERIHHIDANVEYCSLIKTKLGAHRILMGAEMDCCDWTDDGRRIYIELKTSREVVLPVLLFHGSWVLSSVFDLLWCFSPHLLLQLDYHTEERFEREKLLKFWVWLPHYRILFSLVSYGSYDCIL